LSNRIVNFIASARATAVRDQRLTVFPAEIFPLPRKDPHHPRRDWNSGGTSSSVAVLHPVLVVLTVSRPSDVRFAASARNLTGEHRRDL
jgi:hypothetical protein